MLFLIRSANPKSRPVGMIVFAHVVCLSVRPPGVTMDLTKWIIDDTCLVFLVTKAKTCFHDYLHAKCFLSIAQFSIAEICSFGCFQGSRFFSPRYIYGFSYGSGSFKTLNFLPNLEPRNICQDTTSANVSTN